MYVRREHQGAFRGSRAGIRDKAPWAVRKLALGLRSFIRKK